VRNVFSYSTLLHRLYPPQRPDFGPQRRFAGPRPGYDPSGTECFRHIGEHNLTYKSHSRAGGSRGRVRSRPWLPCWWCCAACLAARRCPMGCPCAPGWGLPVTPQSSQAGPSLRGHVRAWATAGRISPCHPTLPRTLHPPTRRVYDRRPAGPYTRRPLPAPTRRSLHPPPPSRADTSKASECQK
jgi:hypothetical protein